MIDLSPIALGFLGSLAAGAMTAVGAIPVLFGRIPAQATRDLSLGFAAGVMLSASFFSLIIPALEAAAVPFDNSAAPAAIVCLAILLGMGAVALMNEKLPHEHLLSRSPFITFPRASPLVSGSGLMALRVVCRLL
jgi:ZIP family zinc transporter